MSIWTKREYLERDIEQIEFYQSVWQYHKRINNDVYDSLVRNADKRAYKLQMY